MLKFTKMEGLGNDYVYMDAINQKIAHPKELAMKISDRHFGIGSDGLILIGASEIADFKMSIYNPDGTEAEMCGNGIRCVGKFLYDKGYISKTKVTIETLAGVKNLELILEYGKVKFVKVDMGEPIFEPALIPVKDYILVRFDNLEFAKVKVSSLELTCVSMGNPHAVCFVSNVDDIDILKMGPLTENADNFPKRVNAEFTEIKSRGEIKMRVWERGARETLACGTGACASVVASILNGYTEREVTVSLLGGKLNILWDKDNNHVYMTGPARIIYEGEIDLD